MREAAADHLNPAAARPRSRNSRATHVWGAKADARLDWASKQVSYYLLLTYLLGDEKNLRDPQVSKCARSNSRNHERTTLRPTSFVTSNKQPIRDDLHAAHAFLCTQPPYSSIRLERSGVPKSPPPPTRLPAAGNGCRVSFFGSLPREPQPRAW